MNGPDFRLRLWEAFRRVQQIKLAKYDVSTDALAEKALASVNAEINAMSNVELLDALTG